MSKRAHILAVAESLFNRHGFTQVGVDAIRDQAQVSKTSMYRHFGSKTALIKSVLELRHQRFEDQLQLALERGQDRLEAILDWLFDWLKQPDFFGCMYMHALSEFKHQDEGVTELAKSHKAWFQSLLLPLFDHLDAPKKHAQAELLMTFLEGIIVRGEFGFARQHEPLYRQGALAIVRGT